MFTRRIIHGCLTGILIIFVLSVSAGISAAIEYNLAAGSTTINYAGTDITMWGFAQCTDNTFTSCGPVTVPGPQLTVSPGGPLTINLKNNLTVPVSIIIPGQSIVPSPTDVGGRVMSFTTETAPGGTRSYIWTTFKPGTFIYQSGTNPAVQVQMGLYGAVTKDFASGQAYDSTPASATQYANNIILLFSEIDPALHQAVADGKYGVDCAAPPCTMTSTIDFKPKYFLINGKPFTSGSPHISAGTAGQKTLLRFMNAGLRDYVPLLQGLYMTILAENGNLLPYPKSQYSMILPAGNTMDAMIEPTIAGTFPIYDRRFNLTNSAVSPGGMLTYLDVAPDGIPTAVDDSYTVARNTTLNIAAPGVLGNDANPGGTLTANLVTGVSHGTLTLNSNGSFSYVPTLNYSGPDSFTYRANNGIDSNVATVTISVTAPNAPPVAVNDSATTVRNTPVTINVISNDYDSDGSIVPSTVVIVTGLPPKKGTVTPLGDGRVRYTPPTAKFTGKVSFTYTVNDNLGATSNIATVTVTVTR